MIPQMKSSRIGLVFLRKRPQTTANDHKNDRKRLITTANDRKNSSMERLVSWSMLRSLISRSLREPGLRRRQVGLADVQVVDLRSPGAGRVGQRDEFAYRGGRHLLGAE